jgi:carbamoyltransferase
MDLACSIQVVLEEVMLRMVKNIHKEFHSENLCLAGGVALNCVANGRIIRETPIKRIWIQPAAGDAGGAVGAAFSTWYQFLNNPLHPKKNDMMKGAFLGPCYVGDAIHSFLEKTNAEYYLTENSELYKNVAKILAQEKVVGWFQGRMEFGPRALGCRSILGDPRSSEMQSTMNLKIKYRESFRPFAPSVLFDKASSYFDINCESPYMLLVAKLLEKHRVKVTAEDLSLWGIDKLKLKRSSLPAITHLDYSARLQTVHPDTNPKYYQLISAFYELTGCPVLVNTSFNVRGEPIVCTPEDAYRCFMRTEMDVLVLENYILYKEEQPAWEEDGDWQTEFELD